MNIVRCPRCAKEVPDASRFCRRCGCSLVYRSTTFTAPVVPPEMPPLPPLPTAPHPFLYDNRRGGGTATVTRRPPTRRTAPPPKQPSGGGGGGAVIFLCVCAAFVFIRSQSTSVKPKVWTPPAEIVKDRSRPYPPPSYGRIDRTPPPISHPLPLTGGAHDGPILPALPEPPAFHISPQPPTPRGPERGYAPRYQYVHPAPPDPHRAPGHR